MIKIILIVILITGIIACKSHQDKYITITEVEYQQLPHFKVITPNATYLINKGSGGAASIIDKEGIDWINHSKTFEGKTTNGADSEFRGLPNLVHREPGDGIGHPVGEGLCKTVQITPNKLYVTSNCGLWEFSWTFKKDHAALSVEKTDTSRNYWFLFEGPVAGKFNPASHYWANDTDGVRTDKPSIRGNAVTGNWQWAYFGDINSERSFFVSMTESDTLTDFFAYMGNINRMGLESEDGMNVFGFGRSHDVKPRMKGKNTFVFGFYEKKLNEEDGYEEFHQFINGVNNSYKK